MNKTFLLGVGAQKSGATCLHKYSSDNQNVSFGPLKESHIRNGIYVKECANFLAKKEDKFRYALQNIGGAYESDEVILRTNYKSTINALELAFEKDQIYCGLYEELLNGEKVKAISDFCGVAFNPDYVSKKFNVSPKLAEEAMVLKQEVRDFYSEVYEFCLERFPQTKAHW